MNKTLSMYIRQCSDDFLYKLFEYIIDEMNKRKEKKKC